ncbi:MAG: glycosyltransferase [Actinomycetota bacterium]|nr:glycosyltransferase [Actinomycetota bacterium]
MRWQYADGLRIAQLANFVGPASGGMKTAIEALGSRYAEAGADRLLVTPGARDEVEHLRGGTLVRVRAPRVGGGYRLIVEPWRVMEVLDRFAPTSVEISDKSTLLPVTGWARRAGVGCVLFSHERLDAMVSMRTGWRSGIGAGVSVLNRVLTRRFDAIVVTSRFAAQEFPAAAAPLLCRIPLGVDLATFHPEHGRPAADGVLGLVHVGRLSREKSPHLAVATAVALHRRGVPVRLDVFGQGPHEHELHALAAGAPVTFHGHVGNRRALAARLASADIALSVCPGETFGLAILEALACGTPVVTADRGGGCELIDPDCGERGAPEPEALADAALRLAERHPAGRRKAARRRAEGFRWADTARAMLDLHAGVAGRVSPEVVSA